MAFLYTLNELKPCPLKDVPVGGVVVMLDSDQTFYLRVDMTSPDGGGTFVALDGALTVAQVASMNMGKKGQCPPSGELRLSVGALGGRSNDIQPGQIVLSEDGPVLGVSGRDQMGFTMHQYVSMTSWQFIDYPARNWQMEDCKIMWAPVDSSQEPIVLRPAGSVARA